MNSNLDGKVWHLWIWTSSFSLLLLLKLDWCGFENTLHVMFQSFLKIISEFYLKLWSFKGFKGSVWVYNDCWPAHMKEGSGEHSRTHWHVQEHRSSSLCILNFEIAAQMFIYQLGSVCLLDNLFRSCKQTSTFRKEKKKNAIQNKIITFQYCFNCSDSVTCRKELEELHAYLTPPLFHKLSVNI